MRTYEAGAAGDEYTQNLILLINQLDQPELVAAGCLWSTIADKKI